MKTTKYVDQIFTAKAIPIGVYIQLKGKCYLLKGKLVRIKNINYLLKWLKKFKRNLQEILDFLK